LGNFFFATQKMGEFDGTPPQELVDVIKDGLFMVSS
jgi:hypothetical protein